MSLNLMKIPAISVTPDDENDDKDFLTLTEALTDIEELDTDAVIKNYPKSRLKIKLGNNSATTDLEDFEASENEEYIKVIKHDKPLNVENLDLDSGISEEVQNIGRQNIKRKKKLNTRSSTVTRFDICHEKNKTLGDDVFTDCEDILVSDFDTDNELPDTEISSQQFLDYAIILEKLKHCVSINSSPVIISDDDKSTVHETTNYLSVLTPKVAISTDTEIIYSDSEIDDMVKCKKPRVKRRKGKSANRKICNMTNVEDFDVSETDAKNYYIVKYQSEKNTQKETKRTVADRIFKDFESKIKSNISDSEEDNQRFEPYNKKRSEYKFLQNEEIGITDIEEVTVDSVIGNNTESDESAINEKLEEFCGSTHENNILKLRSKQSKSFETAIDEHEADQSLYNSDGSGRPEVQVKFIAPLMRQKGHKISKLAKFKKRAVPEKYKLDVTEMEMIDSSDDEDEDFEMPALIEHVNYVTDEELLGTNKFSSEEDFYLGTVLPKKFRKITMILEKQKEEPEVSMLPIIEKSENLNLNQEKNYLTDIESFSDCEDSLDVVSELRVITPELPILEGGLISTKENLKIVSNIRESLTDTEDIPVTPKKFKQNKHLKNSNTKLVASPSCNKINSMQTDTESIHSSDDEKGIAGPEINYLSNFNLTDIENVETSDDALLEETNDLMRALSTTPTHMREMGGEMTITKESNDPFSKKDRNQLAVKSIFKIPTHINSPVVTDTEEVVASADEDLNSFSRVDMITPVEFTKELDSMTSSRVYLGCYKRIDIDTLDEVMHLKCGGIRETYTDTEEIVVSDEDKNKNKVFVDWKCFSVLYGVEQKEEWDTSKQKGQTSPPKEIIEAEAKTNLLADNQKSKQLASLTYESALLMNLNRNNPLFPNIHDQIDNMLEKILNEVTVIEKEEKMLNACTHDRKELPNICINYLELVPSSDALIEIPVKKSNKKYKTYESTHELQIKPANKPKNNLKVCTDIRTFHAAEESISNKHVSINSKPNTIEKHLLQNEAASVSFDKRIDKNVLGKTVFDSEKFSLMNYDNECCAINCIKCNYKLPNIWYEGTYRNLSIVPEADENDVNLCTWFPNTDEQQLDQSVKGQAKLLIEMDNSKTILNVHSIEKNAEKLSNTEFSCDMNYNPSSDKLNTNRPTSVLSLFGDNEKASLNDSSFVDINDLSNKNYNVAEKEIERVMHFNKIYLESSNKNSVNSLYYDRTKNPQIEYISNPFLNSTDIPKGYCDWLITSDVARDKQCSKDICFTKDISELGIACWKMHVLAGIATSTTDHLDTEDLQISSQKSSQLGNITRLIDETNFKQVLNLTNAFIQSESITEPYHILTAKYIESQNKSDQDFIKTAVAQKENASQDEKKNKRGIFGTLKTFISRSIEHSDSDSEHSSKKNEKQKKKKHKTSKNKGATTSENVCVNEPFTQDALPGKTNKEKQNAQKNIKEIEKPLVVANPDEKPSNTDEILTTVEVAEVTKVFQSVVIDEDDFILTIDPTKQEIERKKQETFTINIDASINEIEKDVLNKVPIIPDEHIIKPVIDINKRDVDIPQRDCFNDYDSAGFIFHVAHKFKHPTDYGESIENISGRNDAIINKQNSDCLDTNKHCNEDITDYVNAEFVPTNNTEKISSKNNVEQNMEKCEILPANIENNNEMEEIKYSEKEKAASCSDKKYGNNKSDIESSLNINENNNKTQCSEENVMSEVFAAQTTENRISFFGIFSKKAKKDTEKVNHEESKVEDSFENVDKGELDQNGVEIGNEFGKSNNDNITKQTESNMSKSSERKSSLFDIFKKRNQFNENKDTSNKENINVALSTNVFENMRVCKEFLKNEITCYDGIFPNESVNIKSEVNEEIILDKKCERKKRASPFRFFEKRKEENNDIAAKVTLSEESLKQMEYTNDFLQKEKDFCDKAISAYNIKRSEKKKKKRKFFNLFNKSGSKSSDETDNQIEYAAVKSDEITKNKKCEIKPFDETVGTIDIPLDSPEIKNQKIQKDVENETKIDNFNVESVENKKLHERSLNTEIFLSEHIDIASVKDEVSNTTTLNKEDNSNLKNFKFNPAVHFREYIEKTFNDIPEMVNKSCGEIIPNLEKTVKEFGDTSDESELQTSSDADKSLKASLDTHIPLENTISEKADLNMKKDHTIVVEHKLCEGKGNLSQILNKSEIQENLDLSSFCLEEDCAENCNIIITEQEYSQGQPEYLLKENVYFADTAENPKSLIDNIDIATNITERRKEETFGNLNKIGKNINENEKTINNQITKTYDKKDVSVYQVEDNAVTSDIIFSIASDNISAETTDENKKRTTDLIPILGEKSKAKSFDIAEVHMSEKEDQIQQNLDEDDILKDAAFGTMTRAISDHITGVEHPNDETQICKISETNIDLSTIQPMEDYIPKKSKISLSKSDYISQTFTDENSDSKRKPLFHLESEEEHERFDNKNINDNKTQTVQNYVDMVTDVADSEFEIIEQKLNDLEEALGTLEKIDLNLNSKEDKKLRRVERKFERMASEVLDKYTTVGKEESLSTPEIEEKQENEFKNIIAQLNTEEISDYQKYYTNLWDEHTFSPSDEWDSKTPDSQNDVQDLPQGEVVYMGPVTLNKDNLVNKAGVEVDIIPIKHSPCSSPLLRNKKHTIRPRSEMGFNHRQKCEDRGSLPDLQSSVLKGSIMNLIIEKKKNTFLSKSYVGGSVGSLTGCEHRYISSLDSSDSNGGNIMHAVTNWLHKSSPFSSSENVNCKSYSSSLFGEDDTSDLHVIPLDGCIQDCSVLEGDIINAARRTSHVRREIYFEKDSLDSISGQLTELTPQPKPRIIKSPDKNPTDYETQNLTTDGENKTDNYKERKMFWENFTKDKNTIITTKKRMSLCEDKILPDKVIVKKRSSIHEVSIPPIPKPRHAFQIVQNLDDSVNKVIMPEQIESIENKITKSDNTDNESITKPISEYQASFQPPSQICEQLPSSELATGELDRTDSLDSEIEFSTQNQSCENTGYISDSGDVEHYISDSEIEDRVPQIRERQMSIAVPYITTRKTVYERSSSLPTEDLYEVSARSAKLRKQYYEQQIKKEMIAEHLMSEYDEEPSPECKTLSNIICREESPRSIRSVPGKINDEIHDEKSNNASTLRDLAKTHGETVSTKKQYPEHTFEHDENNSKLASVKHLAKGFECQFNTELYPEHKKEAVQCEQTDPLENSVKRIAKTFEGQQANKEKISAIQASKADQEVSQTHFEANLFESNKTSGVQKVEKCDDSLSLYNLDNVYMPLSTNETAKGVDNVSFSKNLFTDSDQSASDADDAQLTKEDSISKPNDSMEVHVDKSEIEDSEKVPDFEQDAIDLEIKSIDSLSAMEVSPKTSFTTEDIIPEITVTLSEKQRRISEESDEYCDQKEEIRHTVEIYDKSDVSVCQSKEQVQDIIWEVSVESQPFEERTVEIENKSKAYETCILSDQAKTSELKINNDECLPQKNEVVCEIEKDEEFSGSVRDESDLGSEIHQDHSDSCASDKIKSESHSEIEKIILESLHQQNVNPEEAKKIADALIEDIEAEIQKRNDLTVNLDEQSTMKFESPIQISSYLCQLAEAKGLDEREVELVESVLARRQRELAKLARDDTQASSMEITDEDLKYSGAEIDYSNILEQQIDQLEAEKENISYEKIEKECEKKCIDKAVTENIQQSQESSRMFENKETNISDHSLRETKHMILEEDETIIETSVLDSEISKIKQDISFEETEKCLTTKSATKSSSNRNENTAVEEILINSENEDSPVIVVDRKHEKITNCSKITDGVHEESKIVSSMILGEVIETDIDKLIASGKLSLDQEKIDEIIRTTEKSEVIFTKHEDIKRSFSDESKSSQEGSGKSPEEQFSTCSSGRMGGSDTANKISEKHDVVLRKTRLPKDGDTSSSSSNVKFERKSGIDFEAYSSSGESHYHSFDLDSGKSRPCSSDVEGFIVAGSSEYESALTSQDTTAPSHLTSAEYHTAVSSLSSKESMKSLDSESSGNLASVEVSEASETLVPSNFESDGDNVDFNDCTSKSKESKKLNKRQSTDLSDSDGFGVEELADVSEDDVIKLTETQSKMKRSCEMTFQPEPKVLIADSPQSESLHDTEEKFGTSLDDGSILSMSLSSTSSAGALRTVIELSRTDSEKCDGSMSFSGTSDQINLEDLNNLPYENKENLITHVSSDMATSTPQHPIKISVGSVTLTSSAVTENGVQNVSTQVTSRPHSPDCEHKEIAVNYEEHVEHKKRRHRRCESTSFCTTTFSSPRPEFEHSFELTESDKYTSQMSIKEVSSDEKKDIDESYETEADQAFRHDFREGRFLDQDSDEEVGKKMVALNSTQNKSEMESISDICHSVKSVKHSKVVKGEDHTSFEKQNLEKCDSFGKLSGTSSEKSSFESEAEAEAAFNMVAHISPAYKVKQICPILEDEDAEKHELETRERAQKEYEKRRVQIRDQSPGTVPDIKITQHMTPLVDRGFRYPDLELEEKEEAQKSTPETPASNSSKSSEETDQGREYILEDSGVVIPEEPLTESKSDGNTVIEKVTQETETESPNSDSFEMVEKPDFIDDFVVIEEVAKEAHESDTEGKSVKMPAIKYKKQHDEEVQEYLIKSAPATATIMTDIKYYPEGSSSDELGFEFEDSPPQIIQTKQEAISKVSQDYVHEYDRELEANKKWIEQQFQGDQAAMTAAGYGYEMEFERGPLEDIKEEDVNDFDPTSSRIGSLGSQKESGGSLGSVKDSFSSTPEYDVLAGRKYFTRSGEHDDVSMSSLQEFENLERAMSLENKRYHQGSQDSSSNGSFGKRYYTSRSGQGDDVSVSSLKEFEGLEKACIAAHKIEVKVKEEEAMLSQIDEGQESITSESESGETISGTDKKLIPDSDEEDYEKRMFEIDEIIRQAQSNVERFIDFREGEKTESIGRGDSFEEVSKVPDLEFDLPSVKSTSKVQWADTEDVMITSTDSLDLKNNKPSHHDSTDSLDQKTTAVDLMTASTDSIEFKGHKSKDIMTDSIEVKEERSVMVSSDSLELATGTNTNFAASSDSIDEDGSRVGYLDHSTSSTGKDFSSSVKEDALEQTDLKEQKDRNMLGSTDSLEATSSTATHATYQYETDSVYSGSLTSGGSNTMVSSTDTIDPFAGAHHVDIGAAVRKVWFSDDSQGADLRFTTEYIDDSSKPYVTEIIEPCRGDQFSHTIHRRVEFAPEVQKVTFRGSDADQKLKQFIENFNEGESIQEIQETDADGNIHVRKIVQKRIIVKNNDKQPEQSFHKETYGDAQSIKKTYTQKFQPENQDFASRVHSLLTTIATDTAAEESGCSTNLITEESFGIATTSTHPHKTRRRQLRYDISLDDQTEVDPREHDWRFNLPKHAETEEISNLEASARSSSPIRQVDQHDLSKEMKELLAELEKENKE